jgi:hypothetical protein
MNKLIRQDGFFSEDGRNFVNPFNQELSKIFSSEEVKNMSTSELRVLGSLLHKAIGDAVINSLSK